MEHIAVFCKKEKKRQKILSWLLKQQETVTYAQKQDIKFKMNNLCK